MEDHITYKLFQRLGYTVGASQEYLEKMHLKELEKVKIQMDKYMRGIE